MAVHCVVPPHPAALFVANKLGADIGTVIVYGLLVGLIARHGAMIPAPMNGSVGHNNLGLNCRNRRALASIVLI